MITYDYYIYCVLVFKISMAIDELLGDIADEDLF